MEPSLLDEVLDNAVFYIPQGNGIVTTDPDTGNPVEGEGSPLVVRCMIKQRKLFVEQDQRQVGSDVESVSIFGRFIDPPILELSETERKEPFLGIYKGRQCRVLLNSVIDSPAITALELEDLVGEAFTGRIIYD